MSSNDVVYAVPQYIRDFAISRGMPITQVNGQRFYGPSFSNSGAFRRELPPNLTEVFVGRIPKLVHEPDLVPIFESAGPIFQMRLMMNFSGNNRGYCFVTYFNEEQADLAIAYLHGFTLPIGSRNRLLACRSVNNKRLILGGIPTYKTLPEIYQEVNHYYPGVKSVSKTRLTNPGAAKCLIFVDYIDHHVAAKARSKMLSQKCHLWGFKITVDWAEPEGAQLPSNILNRPEILQVENLSSTTSVARLEALFNRESFNGVKSIRMFENRAVIFFNSRGQAEAAKLMTNEVNLDGRKIHVGWCHPAFINGRGQRQIRQEREDGNRSHLSDNRSNLQQHQERTEEPREDVTSAIDVQSEVSVTTTVEISRRRRRQVRQRIIQEAASNVAMTLDEETTRVTRMQSASVNYRGLQQVQNVPAQHQQDLNIYRYLYYYNYNNRVIPYYVQLSPLHYGHYQPFWNS